MRTPDPLLAASRSRILKTVSARSGAPARTAISSAVSAFPAEYVRMLDRAEASAATGVAVPRGGWWFEHAGWVIPPRYAAGLLAAQAARIAVRTGIEVAALVPGAGGWQAHDAQGRTIAEADAVVVAAAQRRA